MGRIGFWDSWDDRQKETEVKVFGLFLAVLAVYTFFTCLILIPVPMFLAVLLNSKKMVAKGFFRSSLFLPALVCVVVAGITFRLIFGERPGALMNSFLAHFGVYYLSALQSISDDLFESADIDGANAWQKFRHITVPLLKPTTIYVLTISIYGGLAMFVESKMLFANTETGNKGLTIVGYLYRVGIRKANYGLGSAIGIVLLVLTLLVNVIQLILTGFFKKED